ncbi:hypothetical protein NE237_022758 [Protea cynaroides]|uniref:Uncharacterized protein n=1 Tax=Protea cynaroides TaxID=273540 RepID=A0A9Q0HBL7_9MAGN|nr:hypothetical protein NE237_022758 [Protea cynaroides]
MALNLRQKQAGCIIRMLNLNQPLNASGNVDEEIYKILVYDKFCQDILSPLIHVKELRKYGVTLYFLVDKERKPVPDVPAVYFVQPSPSNIQRIIADVSVPLYENFHLNFSSSVPRPLVEDLASGALKSDSIHRISKQSCYVQLNDPSAGDREIEGIVRREDCESPGNTCCSSDHKHDFRYRPLVHDVLRLRLNRLTVQGGGGANGLLEFPEVAVEIENQLNKYKKDVDEANKQTGGKDPADFDSQDLIGNTKHLMSAVNSLPQLTERKQATPQSELEALEVALRESEVDTCAFQYVKKDKSRNSSLASANSASKNNIVDWAEKLHGHSISAVTAGVKNLLSDRRQSQSVETLTDGKANPDIESFLLFDPRAPKSSLGTNSNHLKGPFKEAIVFMIGAGNYVEFGSLQEFGRSQQPAKHVIYGTTEKEANENQRGKELNEYRSLAEAHTENQEIYTEA